MRIQRKLMLLLIYIFDFYSDSSNMTTSAFPFHALLMVQQFKALFVCAVHLKIPATIISAHTVANVWE